jgi:hypothetical protein
MVMARIVPNPTPCADRLFRRLPIATNRKRY